MLPPSIRIANSPLEGNGLFAARTIQKGEVVWSLDGTEKKLTREEMDALPKSESRKAFQFRDHYLLLADGSEFMNHSCDPNAWWDGDERLVARRDIAEGEEITYDYATSETGPKFTPGWACRCGATACRGKISGSDHKDPAFQEKYSGHLPSWSALR